MRPRVGISACLLGEKVRHDGGDKREPLLVEQLGPYVEWVPVCPEVEIGMGTPREPVHLVRSERGVRMLATETGTDYTDTMNAWAERRLRDLAAQGMAGYVLKKNSPSCGKQGVSVFSRSGEVTPSGRGLFAEALLRRFPGLPIEEEDRLRDEQSLQTFLERVIAYHRARKMPDVTGRSK